MASYLGSLLLFFMGFFVASCRCSFKRGLGTLLDPIGIRFIVEDLAHPWTTIEKNWRLLALEGTVLTNRLLWLGVALRRCSPSRTCAFASRIAPSASWLEALDAVAGEAHVPDAGGHRRRGERADRRPAGPADVRFRHRRRVRRSPSRGTSFRTIATSWAGLALLVAIPLLTVPWCSIRWSPAALPLVPTTARVLSELTAPLSAELSRWVIIPLLIVFFAGELVWREREAGLGEITDAMPGSEWAPFLGKFLGLGLVLVVFMALLMVAGMLAQVIRGYQDFELGLYLKILFGLQLPEYLLFALLALVVHVLVDQKYVGHLVAIMAYRVHRRAGGDARDRAQPARLRRRPGVVLHGDARLRAVPRAVALVQALLGGVGAAARGGGEAALGARPGERASACGSSWRAAVSRGPTAWVAGVAAVLILTLGGFIFYNTNVLNDVPQPVRQSASGAPSTSGATGATRASAAAAADGDQPARRDPSRAAGGGDPRLVPPGEPQQRCRSIPSTWRRRRGRRDPGDHLRPAGDARGATTRSTATGSTRSRGRSQPGDTLRLDFEVHVEPRGFGNRGVDAVGGGERQLLHQAAWFPCVGYQAAARARRAPRTGGRTGSRRAR